MLASLAILLTVRADISAPILPPGCSPDFQRMVISVEQSLKDGEYDEAGKKFQLLPKAAALYEWDDSKVPAAQRQLFTQAMAGAIASWGRALGDNFSLKRGTPSDIKFDFEPKLANAPDSQGPSGLATFLSETTLPRLEAVSGLARGSEAHASTATDIQNDCEYAIGIYLGVAGSPIPSTSMARSDSISVVPNVVTASEMAIAKQNLLAVDILRKAIHAHVRLEPAQPIASLDSTSLSIGPVFQGQRAFVPLLITNVGRGELTYNLIGDCSCITTGPAGSLRPNEAKLVDIQVDTSAYTANIVRKLLVLTNDAENPARVVPIELKVKPRYRWIVPGGATRIVGDAGADVDLYLEIPFGSGLYAQDVHFAGVEGAATFEQWSGDLADPEHGEGVKSREGYHVKLHVKGNIYGGRQVGTVTVDTTSDQFPQVNYSLAFQKGIYCFPDDLNLGVFSGASKTYYVTLTRPGKPFRLLATSVSSKSLTAIATKVAGTDDYRIAVSVTGKPSPGDYLAVIHVYTDDPRQPKIDIPVRGTVE